jgi:multicomponent K+:H+ antiporter subunit E
VSRVLPQPLVSLSLLGVWLLTWNSVAPGLVLLGALVAVVVPRFTARFWPEYPRTVRYGRLLRFLPLFLWDVLVANVTVAALILGPRSRLRPGFLVVPLETRDPYVITLLASVVTLTPGTVSANLSGDRRTLLVHALDVADAPAAAARITRRYERPLMEIFPC